MRSDLEAANKQVGLLQRSLAAKMHHNLKIGFTLEDIESGANVFSELVNFDGISL